MRLFFTSDQHFGHTNILKYAKRPFEPDYKGMIDCAKFMYDTYQQTVSDNDVVVFLGDLALINNENKDAFSDLFQSMKGTKLLVLGNHDRFPVSYYKDAGFCDVRDYHIVKDHFVCHYPCTSSFSSKEKLCTNAFKHSGCTDIWHGHIHEKHSPTFDGVKRHNMCVDYAPNGFKPVEILNKDLVQYFSRFH